MTLKTLKINKKIEIKFLVWSQCAGLDLKGEIDTSEPRFLCERHFSPQYLSQQSRRKMLVQTAIPEKWQKDLFIYDELPNDGGEFTIICKESPIKQRKSKFQPRSSTGEKKIEENMSIALHSNLKHKIEASEDEEEIVEEQIVEQLEQSSFEVLDKQTITLKQDPESNKKPLYVVVKRQKLNSLPNPPPKTIMNFNNKPQVTTREAASFIVTEEGNIASSEKTRKVDPVNKKKLKPTSEIEGCTEFIFSGEIYVQMPKRVFDAERERLQEDVEKYKAALRDLRATIDETLNLL